MMIVVQIIAGAGVEVEVRRRMTGFIEVRIAVAVPISTTQCPVLCLAERVVRTVQGAVVLMLITIKVTSLAVTGVGAERKKEKETTIIETETGNGFE